MQQHQQQPLLLPMAPPPLPLPEAVQAAALAVVREQHNE